MGFDENGLKGLRLDVNQVHLFCSAIFLQEITSPKSLVPTPSKNDKFTLHAFIPSSIQLLLIPRHQFLQISRQRFPEIGGSGLPSQVQPGPVGAGTAVASVQVESHAWGLGG